MHFRFLRFADLRSAARRTPQAKSEFLAYGGGTDIMKAAGVDGGRGRSFRAAFPRGAGG